MESFGCIDLAVECLLSRLFVVLDRVEGVAPDLVPDQGLALVRVEDKAEEQVGNSHLGVALCWGWETGATFSCQWLVSCWCPDR